MTEIIMATELNGIFNQNLGVSPRNNTASALNRLVLTSHIRACTNCVRAKAKCSASTEAGAKCERCYRMSKDCQPSPPVRKRRTVKKPYAKDTSALEEKLDGLVTLLKSATQGAPGIVGVTSASSPPEGSTLSSHDSASASTAAGSVGYGDYMNNRPIPCGMGIPDSILTPAASSSSSSGSTSVNLQPILHPSLEPSPEEAELYLNRFRTEFVGHLPFIVIPLSMTAHQLRQERPILWVCIMSAASTSSTQQIVLSNEVRAILGREAFIKATRSMDLLLGILVYIAWDRRHCFDRPILMSLVQLAIAILYDLCLDKAVSIDPALILTYDLKGKKKPSRLSRPPTMEERRTLLGCFLVSSVSASFLRRGDTLRWTAYSDECLRMIDSQKEFPSDALLVQLVKLRLISERATELPWSCIISEANHSMKYPVQFYLKSLETQLHNFKSNIPSELIDNKVLLMGLYNTEQNVYEIGLSQTPDIFLEQYNRRFECLCAYLNAMKSWIDVYLGIPPARYVGFSSSIYSDMARFFMGVYRLSTFEHPEWDRGLVRENLDVSSYLVQAETNFAQVREAAGLDLGGSDDLDTFTEMASKTRLLKMSWDALNPSTVGSQGVSPSDEIGDFSMEFADDDWLRDLLGFQN